MIKYFIILFFVFGCSSAAIEKKQVVVTEEQIYDVRSSPITRNDPSIAESDSIQNIIKKDSAGVAYGIVIMQASQGPQKLSSWQIEYFQNRGLLNSFHKDTVTEAHSAWISGDNGEKERPIKFYTSSDFVYRRPKEKK